LELQYEIVIAHYNAYGIEPLALKCLQSIKEHSDSYRVIWVQNGDTVPEQLLVLLQTMPNRIILNQKNMGFIKAANQGIRLSKAPYVVLMNNDTEAVPGWLEKLRAPLEYPCMMSGPRTTTPESWQGKWAETQGCFKLPRTAMLAFFCTMFDRKVFDIVGCLDEDFGVGFGDDDNYCARVQAKGLRLVLVQDLVIPHHHRSTFKALYTAGQIHVMQQEAMTKHKRKLISIR
jgi:GT2 family glycosyltransferase